MTLFRNALAAGLLVAANPVFAQDFAPVALNSLSAAPDIRAAAVMDQEGHVLGQAERIATDQNGKPAALSFRTLKGGTVVVSAAAVSYDQPRNLLVTDSQQPQIAALTGKTAVASLN